MHHTNPTISRYQIVRFGGRCVMVLPNGSRRLQLRAVSRYQAATLKKLALRTAVGLVVRLGFAERVFETTLDPVPENWDFQRFLIELQSEFAGQKLFPFIVWPPQTGRGRIYIHLLRSDGNPVAFVKLALDEVNGQQLSHEAQVLRQLHEEHPRRFRVPQVLAHGRFQTKRFLAVEPLASHARPMRSQWGNKAYPAQSVAEYQGTVRTIGPEQLLKQSWYTAAREWVEHEQTTYHRLDAYETEQTNVCRVHGDFGPANLAYVDGQLWIVDWEASSECGPLLTDPVSFYLAGHTQQVQRSPQAAVRQLTQTMLAKIPSVSSRDVALALMYLHTVGLPSATILLQAWYVDEVDIITKTKPMQH